MFENVLLILLLTSFPTYLLKPTRKEDIMVYTLAQKILGAIKRREEPQQSNEERFLQALTDGQIEDLLASLVKLDSRRLLPPKKKTWLKETGKKGKDTR
jgi:YesN/AraC family two-component response regulator